MEIVKYKNQLIQIAKNNEDNYYKVLEKLMLIEEVHRFNLLNFKIPDSMMEQLLEVGWEISKIGQNIAQAGEFIAQVTELYPPRLCIDCEEICLKKVEDFIDPANYAKNKRRFKYWLNNKKEVY